MCYLHKKGEKAKMTGDTTGSPMSLSRLLWVRLLQGCDSMVAREIADAYSDVSIAPHTGGAHLWSREMAADLEYSSHFA